TLRAAIRYSMVHNMAVQMVYPYYEIPDELKAVIETVDSCRIMPVEIADGSADVVVVNGWDFKKAVMLGKPTTVRISKDELFERYADLIPLLISVPKLNVVITDVHKFSKADFETYKAVLKSMREKVANMFLSGGRLSVNLLTDRLMLKQMNNCGAGDTSITLSPEGRFYICPAFYYDDPEDSVGCVCDDDIAIDNAYLYTLKGAPICRHCDAWHCKRCVWMNRLTTHEVNTPSHE
ncbi:MAG: CXXX repeat peptide maturase, partial [Muribaculaceae bacterium]|nr:CXXX repeat peptide maturase [Muribaculaceae bacterium]